VARLLLLLALVLLAPVSGVASARFFELTGPAARERLSHGEGTIRAEAARTLGYHGEHRAAVDALVAALPGERDAVVRREIVLALARRGDRAAVPVLIDALAAAGTPNQVVVAHALASFPGEPSIVALTEGLEQDHVRSAARRSLVTIGPPAVPNLLLAARGRPGSVAAVLTLGEIGDQRALPTLVDLLAAEAVPMRVAAIDAIARMRAERGGPFVAPLTGDDEKDVVLAAVRALGVVGGPPHAGLLEERLDADDPVLRREALRALVSLAPGRAIPYLERYAAEGDPSIGPLAVELVQVLRIPEAAALLHGLLREGTRSQEAASALAELESGAGLAVLVHVAEEDPSAPGVMRAIAVCLRRYADVAPTDDARAARAILGEGEGARALLLRAVARDRSAHDEIIAWLSSDDAEKRAVAALSAEVHPDSSLVEPLISALASEEDPEAYRRIAGALSSLDVAVDAPALLIARFDDLQVGPEAMLLAAVAYEDANRWTQRRLGAAFRRALRAADVRLRTGAAWALARTGDRAAHRPLAVALDDAAPEVRHAAARALSALSAARASRAIDRRLRVEEDEVVAQALRDALSTRRPFPARGLSGDQVLRVRIVVGAGVVDSRIPVDVVLPDGRFLRMRTLASGELLLVDLPSGSADVRVRVGGST